MSFSLCRRVENSPVGERFPEELSGARRPTGRQSLRSPRLSRFRLLELSSSEFSIKNGRSLRRMSDDRWQFSSSREPPSERIKVSEEKQRADIHDVHMEIRILNGKVRVTDLGKKERRTMFFRTVTARSIHDIARSRIFSFP